MFTEICTVEEAASLGIGIITPMGTQPEIDSIRYHGIGGKATNISAQRPSEGTPKVIISHGRSLEKDREQEHADSRQTNHRAPPYMGME
jgi:hypothetical protein